MFKMFWVYKSLMMDKVQEMYYKHCSNVYM
jgi:hypothetical protein